MLRVSHPIFNERLRKEGNIFPEIKFTKAPLRSWKRSVIDHNSHCSGATFQSESYTDCHGKAVKVVGLRRRLLPDTYRQHYEAIYTRKVLMRNIKMVAHCL